MISNDVEELGRLSIRSFAPEKRVYLPRIHTAHAAALRRHEMHYVSLDFIALETDYPRLAKCKMHFSIRVVRLRSPRLLRSVQTLR